MILALSILIGISWMFGAILMVLEYGERLKNPNITRLLISLCPLVNLIVGIYLRKKRLGCLGLKPILKAAFEF